MAHGTKAGSRANYASEDVLLSSTQTLLLAFIEFGKMFDDD
jgi:hypothetical protein